MLDLFGLPLRAAVIFVWFVRLVLAAAFDWCVVLLEGHCVVFVFRFCHVFVVPIVRRFQCPRFVLRRFRSLFAVVSSGCVGT